MRPISYIVIHTAAANLRNVDASLIGGWHTQKGWKSIGYHYVIINDQHDTKADGTLEEGRHVEEVGAHAQGLNASSIGVCCVGHGDINPFTAAQLNTLYTLVLKLMKEYNIPVENVIGHKEVNSLVSKGVVEKKYGTTKTCPGDKVDMEIIRKELQNRKLMVGLDLIMEKPVFKAALETIEKFKAFYPNAMDEWNSFRMHPEVITILSKE